MKHLVWLMSLHLVLVVLIIWLVASFFNNSVENCWDNYQTEVAAINACET